jgi:hypothetical protein
VEPVNGDAEQDPVESGALESETEGDVVEPPRPHEEPVESGALEDEEE